MRSSVIASLAFFIVTAAGVYAVFTHDLTSARSRLADRSKTIETSFGALEFAEMGGGEPILIVHGAEGGFDQAIDIAGAMASRGYRLIAPSRFGCLRSALPRDPTTAMQADAYAELLDHLGVEKVDVVAISAGAWSSLQFAIRHPERCRALVLIGPADYLPPGTSIYGGAISSAIFDSDFVAWAALKLRPFMPGITGMMLGTDAAVLRAAEPSEKARVQQVLDHLLPVSLRLGGMRFDLETAATREPYPIEKIACPVLTISAEDDRFGTAIRAKDIAASVPYGRPIIFPTGGHALVGHIDNALRETASFLHGQPQPR